MEYYFFFFISIFSFLLLVVVLLLLFLLLQPYTIKFYLIFLLEYNKNFIITTIKAIKNRKKTNVGAGAGVGKKSEIK
jgi:hypothetical protein